LLREGQREVSLRTASDASRLLLSCRQRGTGGFLIERRRSMDQISSCDAQRTSVECFLSAVTEMTDVSLSRML